MPLFNWACADECCVNHEAASEVRANAPETPVPLQMIQDGQQKARDAFLNDAVSRPEIPAVAGLRFEVELQRGPGERLGLDIDCLDGRTALVSLIEPGPIQVYNASVESKKRVRLGDRIVQVNEVSNNIRKMVKQLEEQNELTLVLQRGFCRSVSLQLGDKVLGLNFQITSDGRGYGLLIEGVGTGAASDWNADRPDQALQRFDRILEVNNRSGTPGQLRSFIGGHVAAGPSAPPLILLVMPFVA